MENRTTINVAPDLKDLPEFDWNDPKARAWAEDQENRFIRKYGRITPEEIGMLIEWRMELQKLNPKLTSQEAAQLALKKLSGV